MKDTELTISKYGQARSIIVICSLFSIFWFFDINFSGKIPVFELEISNTDQLPFILFALHGYSLYWFIIESIRLKNISKTSTITRFDSKIILLLGFISFTLITKKIFFSELSIPNINYLQTSILIGTGIFLGHFVSSMIFTLFFIRPKQYANQRSLPRIPIATRSTIKATTFIAIVAYCLYYFKIFSFEEISSLWKWFILIPFGIVTLPMAIALPFKMFSIKNKKIVWSEAKKRLQTAFDIHDRTYIINGWWKPFFASSNSESRLFVAAGKGELEQLTKFLDEGDSVDKPNTGGWTALMLATAEEKAKCVIKLLEMGANPNLINLYGLSPLMLAVGKGNELLVDTLLIYEADPNLCGQNQQPALSGATVRGHTEIVEMLLESGANPNQKDPEGKTALFYGAQEGHKNIITILIKNGADVSIEDNRGNTALIYAEKNKQGETAAILRHASLKRKNSPHLTEELS
ncbi:ankyrin repeat domain-containing protein [Maridesulfovibrio salexigens]|uniref:Ankyrin repeat-domain-containing-like protein n=1 Tax=Maridesulfovibrio salexigens (strain ATCC 14822 / DSM 2638 / NCIMB 8403 / VKM B-1763) TaxID=526222 RepID=C6BWE5_MARSD|nr:ankyrin repeat domain-containing protein [Maridesulfovibrio salexigens]ACS78389.1 Ankyrin repeat-domain-containing-like protein [Maridesulfovibrio salexigens DSM 2638]